MQFMKTSAAGGTFSVISTRPIQTYQWVFGDGETSTDAQPSHVYPERGEYTVNVTVSDMDGNFTSKHERITVGYDWHVYGELQAVIDNAEVGDTIFVHRYAQGSDSEYSYSHITVTKKLEIIGLDECRMSVLKYEGTAGILSGFVLHGEVERSSLTLLESNPRISNCVFADNKLEYRYGGGVYARNSAATFEDCTFVGNTADYGGGAVFAEGTYAFPSFYRCEFTQNESSNAGGAILVRGILSEPPEQSAVFPTIQECLFIENRAAQQLGSPVSGGAIHIGTGCHADLVSNVFQGNSPCDVGYDDIKSADHN